MNDERGGHDGQIELLLGGERLEIGADLAQQPVQPENGLDRLHGAGVEPGYVEHGAEYRLDRFQRGFDVGGRIARRSLAGLLDQRRAVEARGVERLQDVVAGGRQEARLAEIGLLREHLRLRQLLVDAGELGGAPRDALFERLVGALQREVGLDPLGDVGIGRDDAAVRHRVGAQLDDAAAGLQFHLPGRAEGGHAVEDGDLRVRRDVAAPRQMPQDLVERDADLAHLVGQVEQHAVLPVPAGQAEILVEDGDALLHLVERDLQEVAIVLQRLGRVVEQPERVL